MRTIFSTFIVYSVEERGRSKRLANEALLAASVAHPLSCLNRCQSKIWRILDDPLSSWAARVNDVFKTYPHGSFAFAPMGP